MRIAFFLDQSFPPDSRVENEAFSLIQAGHEVHLFSLNYKNLTPEFSEVNGILVYRQPAGKLLYKLSAMAYALPWYHQFLKKPIQRFIDKVKPQVLHVHDMLMAPAVMDVNDANFHLPLTLDLHEDRPEILAFYPHLQRFPAKWLISLKKWRKAQTELIKRADKVVLVTPQAIAIARQATGEPQVKFIALPNTIVPEIYQKYPIDQDKVKGLASEFNILYMGDTGLRRGTDTAIHALAKLLKNIPEAQLIFVGKSTQDTVLKTLATHLNVQAHVCFEGWQDVSKFPTYVHAAHVCISPLKRNLHHDTTLANKIFQYMAGGKPLVVSNCPAQVQVVEETRAGLVFEADNAQALADALLMLYQNPEKRQLLGENGLKAVHGQYHWDQTAKGLIDFYTQLEAN